MSRLEELSSLFKDKALPFKSNRRRGGNGISYTEKELAGVRFLGRLIFTVSDIETNGERVTEEEIQSNSDYQLIYELFADLCESGFTDIAMAIRRTYKVFEDQMLNDDSTLDDFPLMNAFGDRKGRSQSSLTVMFRTALSDLVSRERLDEMFKLHQPEKKQKSE